MVLVSSKATRVVLLRKFNAVFVIGVHCYSHKINLTIKMLFGYPKVVRYEEVMKLVHTYFGKSSKHHTEL